MISEELDTQAMVKLACEGEWLNVLGMKIKFLCSSNESQGRYSSLLNTVPKGSGAPPHSHPWDEAFYVLKGEIEILVGDELHRLKTGDYARVPANCKHGFIGISDEESQFIAFESPSHSHLFFQEIHDTVKNMPEDLSKMPAIGARHHITFI